MGFAWNPLDSLDTKLDGGWRRRDVPCRLRPGSRFLWSHPRLDFGVDLVRRIRWRSDQRFDVRPIDHLPVIDRQRIHHDMSATPHDLQRGFRDLLTRDGHGRSERHPSIRIEANTGEESEMLMPFGGRGRATGRRIPLVCVLAAAGVFAMVLTSQPVYGQPPHRGQSPNPSPKGSELVNTPTNRSTSASQASKASSTASAERPADAGRLERKIRSTTTRRRSSVRSDVRTSATPQREQRSQASAPTNASARVERPAATQGADEPVRVAMRTINVAPSRAEGPASTEPSTERGDKPTSRRERRDRRSSGNTSGTRTVITDEFLIEGKLEKPSAYFILRRSSLDYDWARLDAKFSPLVLESVQDPLF